MGRALKDRHILNINGNLYKPNSPLVPIFTPSQYVGELRLIAPSYLSLLLELILNLLVSLSVSCTSVSVEELSSTLADEHEVARGVSMQVMSWFGNIHEGKWSMDIDAVLKEMGLSILRQHKVTFTCFLHVTRRPNSVLTMQDRPIKKDELLAKWKSMVGDTFESSVSVLLLSVSPYR